LRVLGAGGKRRKNAIQKAEVIGRVIEGVSKRERVFVSEHKANENEKKKKTSRCVWKDKGKQRVPILEIEDKTTALRAK